MRRVIISVVAIVILCISGGAGQAAPIDEIRQAQRYEIDFIAAQAIASKNNKDVQAMARVMYHEARGIASDAEVAAVAWCILNRVDDSRWSSNIGRVCRQKHQFAWGSAHMHERAAYQRCYKLARDVYIRWTLEKMGYDAGRVLPREYVFFAGRGGHNHFRTRYKGGKRWGWSLPSPYGN